MADYTSTFTETDGVDDVDAADFSTEFDAIESAMATKYDDSTGALQATSINDTNGNEEIKFTATGTAVNELTVTNAATGNKPAITQTGSDDVGLDIEGIEIHNTNISAVGTLDATTVDGDTVTCNTTLNIPASSIGTAEIAANTVRFNDEIKAGSATGTWTPSAPSPQVIPRGVYAIYGTAGANDLVVQYNIGGYTTVGTVTAGTSFHYTFVSNGSSHRLTATGGTNTTTVNYLEVFD